MDLELTLKQFIAKHAKDYKDANALIKGYARYYISLNSIMSFEDFVYECNTTMNVYSLRKTYDRLLSLYTQKIITSHVLFIFAHNKFCLGNPDTIEYYLINGIYHVNTCESFIQDDYAKKLISENYNHIRNYIKLLSKPYYESATHNFILYRIKNTTYLLHNGVEFEISSVAMDIYDRLVNGVV